MDNLFNASAPEAVETAAPETAKPAKNERVNEMKELLRATVAKDHSYLDRVRSLSMSVEVVNSLGYGDGGNIVIDKEKSTKDNRALTTTSKIIGYRIRNIGTTPIKYQTEDWAQGEDGLWVATRTEKVLGAGETADITRQFMTMFASIPEISFQLANGKIVRGSGNGKKHDDIKAELEAYYFSFNRSEDKQINDDEVKLNVAEKDATGAWVVKPEFATVFGYLNNPKTSGKPGKKAAGTKDGLKLNSSDMAANYVRNLIEANAM